MSGGRAKDSFIFYTSNLHNFFNVIDGSRMSKHIFYISVIIVSCVVCIFATRATEKTKSDNLETCITSRIGLTAITLVKEYLGRAQAYYPLVGTEDLTNTPYKDDKSKVLTVTRLKKYEAHKIIEEFFTEKVDNNKKDMKAS